MYTPEQAAGHMAGLGVFNCSAAEFADQMNEEYADHIVGKYSIKEFVDGNAIDHIVALIAATELSYYDEEKEEGAEHEASETPEEEAAEHSFDNHIMVDALDTTVISHNDDTNVGR